MTTGENRQFGAHRIRGEYRHELALVAGRNGQAQPRVQVAPPEIAIDRLSHSSPFYGGQSNRLNTHEERPDHGGIRGDIGFSNLERLAIAIGITESPSRSDPPTRVARWCMAVFGRAVPITLANHRLETLRHLASVLSWNRHDLLHAAENEASRAGYRPDDVRLYVFVPERPFSRGAHRDTLANWRSSAARAFGSRESRSHPIAISRAEG
jgi:hypothetical protein